MRRLLLLIGVYITIAKAWCPTNFEEVGSQCYFFDHLPEPWHEANGVCEGLGVFLGIPVSLAVLDVGLDAEKQNQLILSKILENNEDCWLGGYAEAGTRNFTWVDGRLMDPTYSYWYYSEPTNETGNCVSVKMTDSGSYKRSYLYSTDCSNSLSVICQTTPLGIQPKPECPSPFEEVGGYCMVSSKHLGLPIMTWEESRSYCQSIEVHSGSADLAVLGLEGQQDQQLLSEILKTGAPDTWLGGIVESGNDTMYWHDGRIVDPTAYYWRYNFGPYWNYLYASRAHVYTYNGHSTVKLITTIHTDKFDFVCQIF